MDKTENTTPATMGNNSIMNLKTLPEGPNASGTVTMALSDLDKMRADHANLKKIAEYLQEHQKEVKVTLVEKKTVSSTKYTSDRYRTPYYCTDDYYDELSVEYKQLADVINVVKKEEADNIQERIDSYENNLKDAANKINALKLERQDLNTLLEQRLQLIHAQDTQIEYVKITELQRDAAKDLADKRQIQIDNLIRRQSELLKEIDTIKREKSWWYDFWH